MVTGPSVSTIPPGISFVDALAEGLIARAGGDPLRLADMMVLLPTRRACRALAEAFLRQQDGAAALLPRMMPLGETEEDDPTLWLEDEPAGGIGELPPPIPELDRILALARLIRNERSAREEENRLSAGQSVRLARDLATLLDQIQTEQLDFDRLAELAPEKYADHWQITLDFLSVLTKGWPGVLRVFGCMDPADRRNQIILARAQNWAAGPPAFPVIAAGSTGSIPATAALLQTVANLPKGEIVLPGLDNSMSAGEAVILSPSHPQYGMARLLNRLEMTPEAVPDWQSAVSPGCDPARVSLIREAFKPPGDQAPAAFADADTALANVRFVTCPGPQEEAGVIALALRQAIETPDRTAALVTPDRNLARRVAAELRRWDIEVDDSAGVPLASSPPGIFLRLIADCLAEGASPVSLLSMLKHPLAAGGLAAGVFRSNVRSFEVAVLRGPRPAAGLQGALSALKAGEKPDEALIRWFEGLIQEADALETLLTSRTPVEVTELLTAHLQFAEFLASDDALSGRDRLWVGDAGLALANFAADLEVAEGFPPILGSDYPAFLDALLSGRTVRPRYGLHPRLHIWGLLEARLQQADLVCLGGLNEGTWPSEPAADPWMSRPMRTDFGLPPPERRVGLSAHDFTQLFCAGEVLLTRSGRVDGTPTVPARWLLLLENRLKAGSGPDKPIAFGGSEQAADLLGWQAALDRPDKLASIGQPAPTPPVSDRPRRLSVTSVETWRRDPYSIYARYVLGLVPLDPIDDDPAAAERGTIIHAALDAFVRKWPDALPPDPVAALIALGEKEFENYINRPGVRAFWWPRFRQIAKWFIEAERTAREERKSVFAEVKGALILPGPAGDFRLTALADRIDVLLDGTLRIVDYKTGSPPGAGDIKLGFAPQLPLEAAIAMAGGFEDVPAAEVSALEFWRLSGGDNPGEKKNIAGDMAALGRAAHQGLLDMIAAYDDPETPYLSQPDGRHASRFAEYDHLARVSEWSAGDEDAE